MVLVIDNYDSFTYNLVQYLGELGAEVKVVRNDAATLEDVSARAARPDRHLAGAGTSRAGGRDDEGDPRDGAVDADSRRLPGPSGDRRGLRRIGRARARCRCTGKRRRSSTTAAACSPGIAGPFVASRYHSLVVADDALPAGSRSCQRGPPKTRTIMGLRHRSWPVHGVQFHPESILTGEGHRILRNFLEDPLTCFTALIEKLTRHEDLTSRRSRRRDDRGDGGTRGAVAHCRPADRPRDERRAAGRDRRSGADDARARRARVAGGTTMSSIRAAPAATGRAPSISPRAPRSSSRPAACASPNTATDRRRASRAAPTSTKRSASA